METNILPKIYSLRLTASQANYSMNGFWISGAYSICNARDQRTRETLLEYITSFCVLNIMLLIIFEWANGLTNFFLVMLMTNALVSPVDPPVPWINGTEEH